MILVSIYALLSVIAVSLVSLIGVFALSISETRLKSALFVLVSLSVGALFGDVLIHILPDAFSEAANPVVVSLLVFGGIFLFFLLEKVLRWHHHAHEPGIDEEAREERERKHIGHLNLISDGLHNMLDGIAIAVSFMASPAIGLATTLAVVFHEIPQEIGDFAILIHSGMSRARAIKANFLSAGTAIVGAVIALIVGNASGVFAAVALPITAGGFIYIAGSDLVPELHKVSGARKSFIQVIAILAGFILMLGLVLVD